MNEKIIDVNVSNYEKVIAPSKLKEEMPLNEAGSLIVKKARENIKKIMSGKDKRKIIITGPCSIHDTKQAKEYAQKLSKLSKKVNDKFVIIMRAYFEKPRTTIGWKGLINDPNINGTYDTNLGLKLARKVLLDAISLGIPCGTEFLEPFTPQFIDDLISWVGIGARTSESPTHRQLASGLSSPVGFKNSTNGDVKVAINAIKSASAPQAFFGMDDEGMVCNVSTKGNKFGHIILRGGKNPNYFKEDIKNIQNMLNDTNLNDSIIVDCSHGNSGKDHKKQSDVFNDIINQINNGNDKIIGIMIESNINEGNQKIPNDLTEFDRLNLIHGVSITDGCVDWNTTEKMILNNYDKLKI